MLSIYNKTFINKDLKNYINRTTEETIKKFNKLKININNPFDDNNNNNNTIIFLFASISIFLCNYIIKIIKINK
jgi:hypothetical protein